MLSLHRHALQSAVLCLLPFCAVTASSQGAVKTLAFGTALDAQGNCPPGVPCVMICGFPPPIDFEPSLANLVLLPPDGTISAPYAASVALANNPGGPDGLIIAPTGAFFRVLPTLAQVTVRFNYADPFIFSTNIPGYDLTGQDLGSVRVVTLTAEPGALLLGAPTTDPTGTPTFVAWNLETMGAMTGVPQAFYSSTLTAQGFGVAQTPEPGAAALLGGLFALSGAAWRRKRK